MLNLSHKDVINFLPTIKFNVNEPFELLGIGYSIIRYNQKSPSFDRYISLETGVVCIEYALYWNYDIEHLYDLEHIWLYINVFGEVVQCEVSFHGEVRNGLLSKTNEENIILFCQAGKHAFTPDLELFDKIDNYHSVTVDNVGHQGLLIPSLFEEVLVSSKCTDECIKRYMRKFAFTVSDDYHNIDLHKSLFMPWVDLRYKIPLMIKEELVVINYHIMMYKTGSSEMCN